MTDLTLASDNLVAPVLRELFRLVEGAGDSAREFKQALLDALERRANFVAVNVDTDAAFRTSKFWLRLEPSQGLRSAVAAARAGNFDKGIIERAFGHGHSSLMPAAAVAASQREIVEAITAASNEDAYAEVGS